MVYYNLDHNNHDPDFQYILDHFEQFNTTGVTLTGEVKYVDNTTHLLIIQINQPPYSDLVVQTKENLNTT